MELTHTFDVPVGIDTAWAYLLDMNNVARCFPGASLTASEGNTYTGTVKVKLGPVQLTYEGAAEIVSTDEATHTATIEASGNAPRGGSTAAMKITATATPQGSSTTSITMVTDLAITGKPAQFGRGLMDDVGGRILGQFATCVAAALAEQDRAARAADTSTATAADEPPVRAVPTPVAGPADDGALNLGAVLLQSEAVKRALPIVGLVLLWLIFRKKRSNRG